MILHLHNTEKLSSKTERESLLDKSLMENDKTLYDWMIAAKTADTDSKSQKLSGKLLWRFDPMPRLNLTKLFFIRLCSEDNRR